MDQTLLSFAMDDNKSYDSTSTEEIWRATVNSDLDKRQCTVQLTRFADGSVLPTLLIFKGEGKRIKMQQKRHWDK